MISRLICIQDSVLACSKPLDQVIHVCSKLRGEKQAKNAPKLIGVNQLRLGFIASG